MKARSYGQAADGKRNRKTTGDQFIDGPVLVLVAGPEIQNQDLAEVAEVLLYQGFIEVVLGIQVGPDFRLAAVSRNRTGRRVRRGSGRTRW